MSDDIVTVAKFQSLPEAEACKLRLEAEGLTVFMTDAETIRTDWLLSNAVGSIKVEVPSAQVETAEALLKEIWERHEEQAKHANQDFCLACGAVMAPETSHCKACGWSYAKVDADESDAGDEADA